MHNMQLNPYRIVTLTAADLIVALKIQQRGKESRKGPIHKRHRFTSVESTHVALLRRVDEALHPGTDVQLDADHWDQTQKPDILHHAGPPRQLSSLNSSNANLARDHRRPNNVMFV